MAGKKVKIKLLKNAGSFVTGQEVEVDEELAKTMCEVRKKYNGYELEDYRTAMTMEEFEKRKAAPIDLGGLTIEEAKELGVKNVVKLSQEEIDRPFHPGFVEKKDPMEMASAKQAEQINQQNKKKAS